MHDILPGRSVLLLGWENTRCQRLVFKDGGAGRASLSSLPTRTKAKCIPHFQRAAVSPGASPLPARDRLAGGQAAALPGGWQRCCPGSCRFLACGACLPLAQPLALPPPPSRELLPLLRDAPAAAHQHGGADAVQRAVAGGGGLHAAHGQGPLRPHHTGAQGPAPLHAARLPQHQHRPRHQRGSGHPCGPLLHHGQKVGSGGPPLCCLA